MDPAKHVPVITPQKKKGQAKAKAKAKGEKGSPKKPSGSRRGFADSCSQASKQLPAVAARVGEPP
eukprot:15462435-Alexandrium_andersonii.AAC.1